MTSEATFYKVWVCPVCKQQGRTSFYLDREAAVQLAADLLRAVDLREQIKEQA